MGRADVYGTCRGLRDAPRLLGAEGWLDGVDGCPQPPRCSPPTGAGLTAPLPPPADRTPHNKHTVTPTGSARPQPPTGGVGVGENPFGAPRPFGCSAALPTGRVSFPHPTQRFRVPRPRPNSHRTTKYRTNTEQTPNKHRTATEQRDKRSRRTKRAAAGRRRGYGRMAKEADERIKGEIKIRAVQNYAGRSVNTWRGCCSGCCTPPTPPTKQ